MLSDEFKIAISLAPIADFRPSIVFQSRTNGIPTSRFPASAAKIPLGLYRRSSGCVVGGPGPSATKRTECAQGAYVENRFFSEFRRRWKGFFAAAGQINRLINISGGRPRRVPSTRSDLPGPTCVVPLRCKVGRAVQSGLRPCTDHRSYVPLKGAGQEIR
jgi:hypothetical protein